MTFNWRNIEDNASPAIRAIRIILLVMIVAGIALIVTRDSWVPKLVDYIVKGEVTITGPILVVPNKPGTIAKPGEGRPVICTMDAKLCPDGSYVARTGPRCEFAPCPTSTNSSDMGTVSGKVTLSPICPVERMPPDLQCAPKGYRTDIKILRASNGVLVKTEQSQSDGTFSFLLPHGNYIIHPVGGNPYPRCSEISLSFNAPLTANIELSCDTGIR